MYKNLIITTLILFIHMAKAQNGNLHVIVDAGDNQGLTSAIENANNGTGPESILVRPGPGGERTFTFTEAYMGTSNALPEITAEISIRPTSGLDNRITFKREIDAPQFRLFEVSGDGEMNITALNIESFSISGNGGAILAGGHAKVNCRGVYFRNNFASGEGGAIYMGGESELVCRRPSFVDENGEFIGNRAGTVGGAISLQGSSRADIKHQVFADNTAGVFGCDLNLNSSINAVFSTLNVENNTFSANCDNVLFENPRGPMFFRNNTFTGRGDVVDSIATVNFLGNLFSSTPTSNKNAANRVGVKAICNDFGSNAFNSLGYNISNENSCMLDQSTDLADTDPMVNAPDVIGVISLKTGSPAIDAGAVTMQGNPGGIDFLPCGYVDSKGLGRPQDANGDGVFECDMGSYEVQGGPDLTPAQSGLYFDTDRNGEGVRVEILDGGRVLASMFTYDPNKNDLMWLVGSGNQVGNSVVIDEVYRTDGGAFGDDFDSAHIENNLVGSMSFVFPNCEANAKPGRMVFESNKSADNPLENLLVEATRITRILTCNQTLLTNKAGRSGAFFDPQRSGEGIFIDVINDQTAVVYFYTFTPTGKQFWLFSSGANISGNTITANMLYPSLTTGFGSGFDPDEVEFSDWGTLIITHQPGCNNMAVSYNSVIPEYGSGDYAYTRITQPAGATCDL